MKRIHFVMSTLLLSMILLSLKVAHVKAPAPAPGEESTLIIGLQGEPAHLNPNLGDVAQVDMVAAQVYNCLLQYDREGNLRGDLAESWEISDDGLTFTFHLAQNATWHDGEPFTSADVKFSFEEIILPFHPGGQANFGRIESIDTPDDYTVVMMLSDSDPSMLYAMNDRYAGILPKHLYEGTDILENPYNTEPIGTGPFKFVEWVKGSHIELERNPDYFRAGHVKVDRLFYKIFPDDTTKLLGLEAGEVDATIRGVPYPDVARLGTSRNIDLLAYYYISSLTLAVQPNLDHPIAGDIEVRKAISYSLNNSEIVNKAFHGIGIPCETVSPWHSVASPVATWAINPDLPKLKQNTTMAEQLLDDAGYPRGGDGWRFELSLDAPILLSWDKAAEVVKDQLEEVGIKINLRLTTTTTWLERVHKERNFELNCGGSSVGPAPEMAWNYFHSAQVGVGPFTNPMGWRNDRVDEILDTVRTTASRDTRKTLFLEFQELISSELPWIPIARQAWVAAWNNELKGYPPGVSLREPLEDVYWITASTPPAAVPIELIVGVVVAVIVVGGLAFYAGRRTREKPRIR